MSSSSSVAGLALSPSSAPSPVGLILLNSHLPLCLMAVIAKLSQAQVKRGWVGLIQLSPTIHPTSIQPSNIHPIKFILQLICISVMCSFTLVSYGSNCKAQTRFSSSWAELALVSINLTTHPPTTPPCGTAYFSGVSCLIESIEACVA